MGDLFVYDRIDGKIVKRYIRRYEREIPNESYFYDRNKKCILSFDYGIKEKLSKNKSK